MLNIFGRYTSSSQDAVHLGASWSRPPRRPGLAAVLHVRGTQMARPPGLVMRAAGDGPSLRQHASAPHASHRTPPVGHCATPCPRRHVRLEHEDVKGGAECHKPWTCTADHPMHLARGTSIRVKACARGNQGARRQVARRKLVERAVASAVVAERGEGVWKQGRAVRTAPAHRGHAPNAARRRPRRDSRPNHEPAR